MRPLVRKRFEEEVMPIIPEKPRTWVEIALKDNKGQPIGGELIFLKFSDGSQREANTDAQGVARVENVVAGSVQICFPQISHDDWHPA